MTVPRPLPTDPGSPDRAAPLPAPITLSGGGHRRLLDTLTRAQGFGFLGPGPVEGQLERSLAFTAATVAPGRALDLGSGGGIPGLALALAWPTSSWVLLDGSVRRCEFLAEAVAELDLTDRVSVVTSRAEDAGRGPLRGGFDLVVARGFGVAAVTAECGAPLLNVGGHLVVAEPPGGAPERWPAGPLAELGLRVGARLVEPVALQTLDQVAACPDRFPRRVGVPAKRPLYR